MTIKTILTAAFICALCTVSAQRRELHILSVNDMHAKIEAMPQLAAIADSLRTLYPSLLVLSAGDNRTGNPLNDMYEPSGYPMVAMMNEIGFNASAIGNHDFDMNSLPKLSALSNFSYICANMSASDSSGVSVVPWQRFDAGGVSVGIIGVVETNKDGRPTTHPDNLRGLTFADPVATIADYEWVSRCCDVTILLSHHGYRADTMAASRYPWLDLIVGGHSHKQLSPGETHNGVLITQNSDRLRFATHTTVVVDSGRVVEKHAEYIDVEHFGRKNAVLEGMVDKVSNNPYFEQVLAQATASFDNIYELGCMVCDAAMEGTGAEVAIHNHKGVRMQSLPAGRITVRDVLTMDPFGNSAYMLHITGEELIRLVTSYSKMEVLHFPHLGGLKARVTLDSKEPDKIASISLTMADGSPIDMKRTYRVATNSYIAAACRAYGIRNMERLNHETSELIIDFLKKKGQVDYSRVRRIDFVKEKNP